MDFLHSRLVFPAWDVWERSSRMQEFRRLRRSQWESAEVVDARTRDRLAAMLAHARLTVPFYRERWADSQGTELRDLPILSKSDVRTAGTALLSDAFVPEHLLRAKTGGSTGTSLQLWFDTRCQQYRNAAAMRSDGWAGWRPGAWVGALWGSPVLPKTARNKLRNALHDRQIYLDTMRLDESSMREFVARLVQKRASVLFGHAHSLFVFANFIDSAGLRMPPLAGIISTSMMLLQNERERIESVLKCRVFDRYGCEEVGLIAAECEAHDGMHVNSEHVVVEIVRADGSPAPAGEPGRLLVTDLNNLAMPLIRYEVGDLAAFSGRQCTCGRPSAMLGRLVGRTADCFVRPDGSLIAGISLVEKTLTAVPGIAQLQLVQSARLAVRATVVPDEHYSQATRELLDAALREAFGQPVSLELTTAASLPQEANGKYRFAICQVQQTPPARVVTA